MDGRRERFLDEIRRDGVEMPPPLAAIYTVSDDPKAPSPIHLLARGDYQSKGAKVGPRPLGVRVPLRWITCPSGGFTCA